MVSLVQENILHEKLCCIFINVQSIKTKAQMACLYKGIISIRAPALIKEMILTSINFSILLFIET